MDLHYRRARRCGDPSRLDTLDRRLGRPTQVERARETLRRWDVRSRGYSVDWHQARDRRQRANFGALVRVYRLAADVQKGHLEAA